MPGWKRYARIILPHVGLILLSVFYVIGGALTFYQLERPNEIAVRRHNLQQIESHQRQMLDQLWMVFHDQSVSDAELEQLTMQHIDNITRLLFEAFETHYISASHLRPATAYQQIIIDPNDSEDYHHNNGTTLIDENNHYDITIADNNKNSDNINDNIIDNDNNSDSNDNNSDDDDDGDDEEYSWTFTTALFFTATLLTTIGYGNLVPVTFQGRMFCIFYALFGVPLILITVADIGKFLSENIVWLYAKYSRTKMLYKQKNSDVKSENDRQALVVKDQLLQFGLEQYISIPIYLIVGMLLGYITAGAILLAVWEHWDFFSGFYFSFITMTTVGFGDIVPIRREYFLIDLCYIVVGLAITTMCIDLVGIQYIRKIHYFGRAIKDARYALVNVRGKMVNVPDLMRYASMLHQKYGQRRQSKLKDHHKGAYVPNNVALIRYIDYGSMASMDSNLNIFGDIRRGTDQPSSV